MFGALGLGLGLSRRLSGRSLVGPNWLNPALSFTRASAATLIRSTDGALVEFGNNAPRFDPALGLLIEGQTTNSVRNPRGEGFSAGAPGSGPTSWSLIPGTEMSVERIGTATVQGVAGIIVRIFAAAPLTVSSNCLIRSEGTQQVAALAGQTWTSGMYAALVSGSLPPGTTAGSYIIERSDVGGFLLQAFTNDPPTTTLRRVLHTRTLTNASTAFVQPDYAFVFASGVQPDFQVFLALPSLVQSAITTSPVVPPIGTPGTTTRFADLPSSSLAALGVAPSGSCTLVGTFSSAAVIDGNLLYLDDNIGPNNTWRLRTFTDGGLYLSRTNAGAFSNATILGTYSVGASFRAAVSIDGAGNASACVNGGTVRLLTGGVTSGLISLRVGHAFGGGGNCAGYVQRLAYLPYPVPDAQLQQLSA